MSTADLVREYPRLTGEVRRKRADGEMSSREMMEAFPPDRRPSQILSEMQAAKVTRAMLSERQLEEVMVDFWLNHFNVYARKGPVPWMLPSYERDAIRPHALGRFRDLTQGAASVSTCSRSLSSSRRTSGCRWRSPRLAAGTPTRLRATSVGS
jgi:hypothetical protein